MAQVRLRGRRSDDGAFAGAGEEPRVVEGMQLDVRLLADVSPSDRARGSSIDVELDDDVVVESHSLDGWTDFVRVGDLAASGAARSGPGEPIDLLEALAAHGADRGRRDLQSIAAYAVTVPAAIKGHLDLLEELVRAGIDLATRPAARMAAVEVVGWLERTTPDERIGPDRVGRAKTHGVYRVGEDLRLAAGARLEPGATLPDGRSLALVHGTFSSTEGGFTPLGGTDEWRRLVDRYDGQVYALEHPTLSVSPARNALDLVTALPERGTVDLVSHSRGGLVGDLVSLATAGVLRPDQYVRRPGTADAELQEQERALLHQLVEAAAGRDGTVGSFVRVAAPARGTILASPRIDRVAKLLLNVIPTGADALGWTLTVLRSLVLAFLDQRTDPRVIPGVEAMMPLSPLVRLLNTAEETPDRLGVIAGDVDRSRWFRWFLEKGADLFYGEDHDYVVDTASMSQGGRRTVAGVSLQAGPDVNHFTYFSRSDSRRRLLDWLVPDGDRDDLPRGFEPLDRGAPPADDGRRTRRAPGEGPVVVVVPDVFGTEVGDDGGIVWPSASRLARDGVRLLDPATGSSADGGHRGLSTTAYRSLLDRLGDEHTVRALAYDWRRSLSEAADDLVRLVDEIGQGPVHLVGHGVGGLVIRAALERLAERRDDVGRVLLVGTPLAGSVEYVRLVAGQGTLPAQLELVDPEAGRSGVASALRRVRGLVEAMPVDERLTAPDTWAQLPWTGLADAGIGAFVGGGWSGVDPIAVAGVGQPTANAFAQPTAAELAEADATDAHPGVTSPHFTATMDGDGVVTARSATDGVPDAYVVAASHADLVTDDVAIDAYVELLRTGRTSRLEPASVGDADSRTALPDARTDRQLFPTAADLERAALGRPRTTTVEAQPERLDISVVHGNLRFATHPVMVGHYAGSPLAGAEWALDKALGGRLLTRDLLGAYPGDIDESVIVPGGADGHPDIGVVIGLGEHGLLTGARMSASVALAAVRLATVMLDRAARRRDLDPDEPLALGISSVLLGTAGDSDVSIQGSVAAVVAGVLAANVRLADNTQGRQVRFDRVEFIELYEDVAIEAVHAAEAVVRGAARSSTTRLSLAREVGLAEGGLPGQPPPDYGEGQWATIIVESAAAVAGPGSAAAPPPAAPSGGDDPVTPDEDDLDQTAVPDGRRTAGLTFTSTSMAARAERIVHSRQLELVDRLTEDLIARDERGDNQFATTLYELLLPNYLKTRATEADNLQLVLDHTATRFPWEMLAPRGLDGKPRPLAIRSGLIRRLLDPQRGAQRADGAARHRRAGGHRALVVGDPPASAEFPPLAGARSEATLVADRLSAGGYDVTALIRGSGTFTGVDVVNALFADEYRVLHIAAHGVHHPDPTRGGVVIGPDLRITGAEIRQLPAIPPLVFLNCCHLGVLERERGRHPFMPVDFAATVAEQLILDGVRAVVAAGWAVDDGAAVTFADVLYDRMLAGVHFGAAVTEARRAVRAEHPGVNTWGAYQCYGDPGFRLGVGGSGEERRPVSPTEVERVLQWLAADRDVDRREVGERIRTALAAVPAAQRSSTLLYAAGRAYASNGDRWSAIEHHRQAVERTDALVPMKSLEELSNLEGRHAVALVDEADAEGDEQARAAARDEARQLIDAAGKRLSLLVALTPTAERHRLVASNHRRAAQIDIDDVEALTRHLAGARDAYELARQAELPAVSPDTTINQGVFELLAALVTGTTLSDERTAELTELVAAARHEAARRTRTRPEFWNRVAGPDGDVLLGLLAGDLGDRAHDLVDAYSSAFEVGSDANQRGSVTAHLDFLSRILAVAGSVDLGDACVRIHDELAAWTPTGHHSDAG